MGITKIERYAASGNIIKNANWASDEYSKGNGTHAFLYESTDFILEAAKEYSTLQDGQYFAYRNIHDGSFLWSATSFFKGENPTNDEMKALKSQIDNIVKELAERIKNGQSADINSLQSKLTIDGVDFTVSQLVNMQKIGVSLTHNMSGNIFDFYPDEYAKLGIANAFAKNMSNSENAQTKLLGTALHRLAERNSNNAINELDRKLEKHPNSVLKQSYEYKVSTLKQSIDMFSGINASESMKSEFEEVLKDYGKMMSSYKTKMATNSGGDIQMLRDLFDNLNKL